jgi:hypothetical protein
MTDYHVIWPPHIRNELLRFYSIASSGTGRETARLNRALAEIEEALRRTPLAAGESRVDDWRLIFEPPLSVDYRVDAAAREVLILRVTYHPGRRR